MKNLNFKENNNLVIKRGQKFYLREEDGFELTCWNFSFFERVRILFIGRLWLRKKIDASNILDVDLSIEKNVL